MKKPRQQGTSAISYDVPVILYALKYEDDKTALNLLNEPFRQILFAISFQDFIETGRFIASESSFLAYSHNLVGLTWLVRELQNCFLITRTLLMCRLELCDIQLPWPC